MPYMNSPVSLVFCVVRSPERSESFGYLLSDPGLRCKLSARRIDRRGPCVAGKGLGFGKPGDVSRHRAAGIKRRHWDLPHVTGNIGLSIVTGAMRVFAQR